jgi:hypothetical protein
VVEEINHDFPFVALGEFTSENSDFSSNEPVDHGDGFGGSVVAGDGNIDEAKRRVRVAESNDGDVDVAGFLDGLEVRLRVSDDDDSGFLVLEGLVIGKSTRSPSGRGSGLAVGETSELDGSSLTIDSGADNHNVFRVSNSGDNSGGELNLLPGFFNVDVMSTVSTSVSDVSLHVVVEIEGTNMSIGSQKSLEIVLLSS